MLTPQGHQTYHDTAHRSLVCSPDGAVKVKGGQAKNIGWDSNIGGTAVPAVGVVKIEKNQ